MPAQIFRVKAKIFRIKFPPLFLPPLILLGRDRRMDEVLHFHLFELARAEDELARRDLIAKGLADLRDTKRHTHARGVKDVFEVYVNSLTCLTAQISRLLVPIAGKVAKVGLNEQIKTARLGKVGAAAFQALYLLLVFIKNFIYLFLTHFFISKHPRVFEQVIHS